MLKAQIKLSPSAQKMMRRLRDELEVKQFVSDLMGFLQKLSQKAALHVVKESLTGTKVLKTRTGALRRSVIGRAELNHGVPVIRVGVLRGPSIKYARIQEEGGTIKPRKASALAIPQEPVLTPAGVHKYVSPRKAPFVFRFVPFRGRNIIGKLVNEKEVDALRDGGDTLQEALFHAKAYYLLAKSVTIPARRWLSTPIRTFLPVIARDVKLYMEKKLATVTK